MRRGVVLPEAGQGVTHLGVSVSPLFDPQGEPHGAICLFTDLTAIITLHRLGLLSKAADYFGTLIIPEAYLGVLLRERENLQPHQRSHPPLRRSDSAAKWCSSRSGHFHIVSI